MRVGRNDLCHCGSGKKYKKCCLSADEAARPAFVPAIELPPASQNPAPVPAGMLPREPAAPREPSPEERAREEFWDAFEAADFDGRIALFQRAVTEPDLIGADGMVDMLLDLKGATDTAERRRQLTALMDPVAEQRPEVYAKCEPFYTAWRITGAVIDGRRAEVLDLATRMGELAGEHIDDFNQVADRLAWHGELEALSAGLRAGWPHVRDSREILAWAINDFADKGANCAMFEWLERNPGAHQVDAELREAVSYFLPELGWRLEAVITRLAGWSRGGWDAADFQFLTRPPSRTGKRSRPRDDDDDGSSDSTDTAAGGDPEERRLWDLALEFIHYARQREGITYTKAWLFEQNIVEYLGQRRTGDLEPRESMLQAMLRPRRKPASRRKPPVPEHVLCPDARSLEAYLADRFTMMAYQPYKAVVTLELLPVWLRFLEGEGLLDPAGHAKTLQELRELPPKLAKLLEEPYDPALGRSLDQWPAISPSRGSGPPEIG